MTHVLHKADSRGLADHGWLHSRHTFSFADYYHPQRMCFGLLRVINDDIVQPSMGFGTHPHQNMEIISIPLKGALRHQDSMGNRHVIRAGEVQVMSAGTGVTHSEYNDSDREEVNSGSSRRNGTSRRATNRNVSTRPSAKTAFSCWSPPMRRQVRSASTRRPGSG